MPRAIGLVTSLGAAALHDVVAALARRVPHLPVVLAPAAVQGANAPAELVQALAALGALHPAVDVILLVRGGGSIEDLWAFNDEALARAIVESPVPVVCGVGHETDFTIADFCADVRAPTPTAAAELVAPPRDAWVRTLDRFEQNLRASVLARVDVLAQRLDLAAERLGRPSAIVARQQLRTGHLGQRLHHGVVSGTQRLSQARNALAADWPLRFARALASRRERLERSALRLQLLDPALVLERGYAWLTDAEGHAVTTTAQAAKGDTVRATLVDGLLDLRVLSTTVTGRSPTQEE
jgi:exodeoxyribonuclease VII large subunit